MYTVNGSGMMYNELATVCKHLQTGVASVTDGVKGFSVTETLEGRVFLTLQTSNGEITKRKDNIDRLAPKNKTNYSHNYMYSMYHVYI